MAEYVGRTIAKTFPGHGKKKFRGTVVSFAEAEGDKVFKIEYEDGDEEEMELYELKPVLQPVRKEAAGKRKAAQPETVAEQEEPYIQAPALSKEEPSRRSSRDKGPISSRHGAQAVPERSLQTELAKSMDDAELRGVVEDVTAKGKTLEADVVRHPLGRQEAGEALCSRAVTCGTTCYISAIRPTCTQPLEEDPPEEKLIAEYEDQANNVLAQLEAVLGDMGSSRDHLLSMTVLLKDIEKGRQPWATVWNGWCSARHLPAMLVQESFLGTEDWLVAMSAIAAVPRQL